MQISLDDDRGSYQIHSYEPGKLLINDKTYTHSVIITQDKLITDWPPQTIEALTSYDLIWIEEQKPELVILGTGEKLVFPTPDVLEPLAQAGIGVEVMDTGAACRTFKVLMAENRRAIAALIIR